MYLRYYRLLPAFAASLSLALAGCSGVAPETVANPATGKLVMPQKVADDDETDQTLWTWIGFAKRNKYRNLGPQTGATVSPVLWEAALDTLNFAGTSSEDPVTGTLVTKWYSPPGKPNERLRVSVFVLSRALRSDSLSLTIDRQMLGPSGQWQDSTVAKDTVLGLENTILQRARQIHAERYRESMYN